MLNRLHALFVSIAQITLCALCFTASPAAAAAPFDGSWNVTIVTQRGTCDSGASLPIRVSNGAIASDLSVVKVSGQVTDNGTLNVNVGDGLKRASGIGRLSETSGSGTWKGGPCSGTWTAAKN
jgi:hypothetical protein